MAAGPLRLLTTAGLMFTISLASSCHPTPSPQRSAPMCTITATLGPADDGKHLTLHLGEGFTIELPELASAGYQWQPRLDPQGPVTLQSSTRSAPAEAAAGAAMLRKLTFCAATPGQTQLTLESRRVWEPNSPPDKTYTLQITTHP